VSDRQHSKQQKQLHIEQPPMIVCRITRVYRLNQ